MGNWSQRILHASATPVRYVSLVCESVRGGGSLSVISSSCNYHGATETHNDDDVPAAAAEEEDSGTILNWVRIEKKPVGISHNEVQGGRSCAGARGAPAEKFGLRRKF